jgi:biotin transport system substrate-specific component
MDLASTRASNATLVRAASVAFAVALTAAAAQFTLVVPFTSVPFTLTPMAVLLTGAALGSRLGALAQVSYLLAGIAGLQVFAPSLVLPPGAGRLLGPTGGFLMAYPIAAFLTGFLAERGWDRRYVTSALAMVLGLAVIFAGGATWYTSTVTHSWRVTFVTTVMPFIVPDLIKIVIASAILPSAWRLFGANRYLT